MEYDPLAHVRPKPKKKHSLLFKINLFKLRYRTILIAIGVTMGTATFGQFIVEEALQNLGFGTGSFLFANTYKAAPDEAMKALKYYRLFHDRCQNLMYVLYIGNPISAIWFQLFMESNEKKIDYWQWLVVNHYNETKNSHIVSLEYPFEGGRVTLYRDITKHIDVDKAY